MACLWITKQAEVEYQNFVLFLWDRQMKMKAKANMLLNPVRRPPSWAPHSAANGAWGVPHYTADLGLRIEPETSRFTTYYSPTRPCGRCHFSWNVCKYTPERPKSAKDLKSLIKSLTLQGPNPGLRGNRLGSQTP